MVYDAMQGLDVGDVLTYAAIAQALGADMFRPAHRSPFYRAANVWGAEQQRAFMAVPNLGYRVVEPAEHEIMARYKHRRSRRQLNKGREVLHRADRSALNPEEVERFDRLEHTMGRQLDMIRRLDARQVKTERVVQASRQEITATAERVAVLEEALRRHGITPE